MKKTTSIKLSFIILVLSSHLLSCSGDSTPPGGGNPSIQFSDKLDPSFGTGGIVITSIGPGNDSANAVAIQTDQKLVTAGSSFNGTNFDIAVVRYNIDGSRPLSQW
jgi:hypothetical protein